MTTKWTLHAIILFGSFVAGATAQQYVVPAPQFGTVKGAVTDANDSIIPGAVVVLQSSVTGEKRSVLAGDDGWYTLEDLQPGVTYHLTISAAGFVTWTSPIITVDSGETQILAGTKLQPIGDMVSITVFAFSKATAAEQVKLEERQRAFGIFPNFLVVYNHNAVPLTAGLKFKLALKAATDPTIFAATAVTAGADQAANTPNYGQGAKSYGQRVGALYANGFADIMIGEAILPSLLHQDPRYFYRGTGTTRSRAFHALSSAFICKGDNGRWELNYSNIGGDLAAGAISNSYYPGSNRGIATVFENALIASGCRMAHRFAQEFILRRFTSGTKDQMP